MGFKTRKANPGLAAAIEALADEACACEDLECAAEVQAKLMELVRGAEEPSQSDQQKIMRSMERFGAAYAKLAMLRRPGRPRDADLDSSHVRRVLRQLAGSGGG